MAAAGRAVPDPTGLGTATEDASTDAGCNFSLAQLAEAEHLG